MKDRMKFSERLIKSWDKHGLTVEERLIEALRELDVYEYRVECMRNFG